MILFCRNETRIERLCFGEEGERIGVRKGVVIGEASGFHDSDARLPQSVEELGGPADPAKGEERPAREVRP